MKILFSRVLGFCILLASVVVIFSIPEQILAQTVYDTTSSLTIPGNTTPYSMNFNTGVIPADATVILELSVLSLGDMDNRDFLRCGGSSITTTTGLGPAPKVSSFDISTCVRNYDLSEGSRICTGNAWNFGGTCGGFYYGLSSGHTELDYARLTITSAGSPSVTTQAVTSISSNTATANGNVTNLGSSNPTQYGHVWSTSTNPTVSDNKTELGGTSSTGAYTSSLTSLLPGTTYYVRSYATNNVATVYGTQQSFTTTSNYSLGYSSGANGSVSGTLSQSVLGGGSGSAVTAVPDSGYYFVSWSDGETANPRTDTNISNNVSVSAIFSASPTVSAISSSPSATSSTITWSSNVNGSSQVFYGLRSALGFQSTKVYATTTSHNINLSNLSSCTRYYYRVVTGDEYEQTATSTTTSFKTTGCEVSSLHDAGQETAVDVISGGSLEIQNNSSIASLTIPDNYSTTSATFQINRLAINNIGPPAGKTLVDENIFKLVAVDDNEEVLTTFSKALTFTVAYSESIGTSYGSGTLDVYNFDNGVWTALGCSHNAIDRTLTCSMQHFSVYAVFGEELSGSSGYYSSPKIYGCRDKKASNYNYFSSHKQELCQYETDTQSLIIKIVNQYRGILLQAYGLGIVLPKEFLDILDLGNQKQDQVYVDETKELRDLEYGMEGEDVKKLQMLLIAEGYSLPAGPTGYFGLQTKYALDAYQVDNSINPRGGYFGTITRTKMKQNKIANLWW